MNALSVGMLLLTGSAGADPLAPVTAYDPANPYVLTGRTDQAPPPPMPGAPGAAVNPMYAPTGIPQTTAAPAAPQPSMSDCCTAPARGLFESDRAFEGFVGPISNPVFAKDPRSNTYARFLFINNNFPGGSVFGGGNVQVYAMQVNLALTERLSFIADKDGIAHLVPRGGQGVTGMLNLAAGLKYTFYRNVETQTLAAAGFMYEIPSGGANVFQNQGSGAIAPFVTFGKEFNGKWHYLQTTGYYAPLHATQGNSYFYNSFHIDRQVLGWLYPLAELNWFWYTGGGNRLPHVVGEGDGLLNLGTQGMAGRHMVSAAFGAKAVLTKNLSLGAVYEFPLSQRHDLMNQRVTVELILRY